MKKNRWDQYSDLDEVDNPLSLAIQEKTVPSNLKIHLERYDGTTNPYDHIFCFQTFLDFYDAIDTAKYHMFSDTLRGLAWTWFNFLLD